MPVPHLPDDLLSVLSALDGAQLALVMADLLTPSEIEAVNERWAIVKHLAAGTTQREISAALGCSVTTVSRGNRQLRHGDGGFALAFDTLAALDLPDPRSDP